MAGVSTSRHDTRMRYTIQIVSIDTCTIHSRYVTVPDAHSIHARYRSIRSIHDRYMHDRYMIDTSRYMQIHAPQIGPVRDMHDTCQYKRVLSTQNLTCSIHARYVSIRARSQHARFDLFDTCTIHSRYVTVPVYKGRTLVIGVEAREIKTLTTSNFLINTG